jgi:hypothetical protein
MVGTPGVPQKFDPPGGSNTGLTTKQILERLPLLSVLALLSYSPVFDAPQAVDTQTSGTPCVPTASASPSRAGRIKGEERSGP